MKNSDKNKQKKHPDIFRLLDKKNNASLVAQLKEQQDRNRIETKGLSTGFSDLDKLINGLQPSNLIILGSRSGMGKTAMALNIAESISSKPQNPVGIISLEMTADQLIKRLVSSQSGIAMDKIQSESLEDFEHQKIIAARAAISRSELIITKSSGLSIIELREVAHAMKEKHGIRLLIVDYLQLITVNSPYLPSENRSHDLSEISRILKILSKELDIPILCLSQLSRKVEERQGHRPIMSDLRDCGAIEDHADVVMFLLRREYYDPYDKPRIAQIIVAKNRHGGVGDVNLMFDKEIAKFANLIPTPFQNTKKDNQDAFARFI